MSIRQSWGIPKESEWVPSSYIYSFFKLNFGFNLREMSNLKIQPVPVENPEFNLIINMEEDKAMLQRLKISLEYLPEGEVYTSLIPEHIANYFFFLVEKENGQPLYYKKVEDIDKYFQEKSQNIIPELFGKSMGYKGNNDDLDSAFEDYGE